MPVAVKVLQSEMKGYDPEAFDPMRITDLKKRMQFMEAQMVQWKIMKEHMAQTAEFWQEQVDHLKNLFDKIRDAGFEQVQIFVAGLSKTITLDVQGTDTVAGLKATIEDMDGCPADAMRLIYCGKQLEDALTMSDYNIKKESVLRVTFGLKGGAKAIKKDKDKDKKDLKMYALKKQIEELKTQRKDPTTFNVVQIMTEIERIGSVIAQNDPQKVWSEWLTRCTPAQLKAGIEGLNNSHDSKDRITGLTEALFSVYIDPLDELKDQLAGSKEGLVAVIWFLAKVSRFCILCLLLPELPGISPDILGNQLNTT